jgi:hypothetical protein
MKRKMKVEITPEGYNLKESSALGAVPGSALIDNDIPELDEMCREYNAGKINLNQLVCRARNGGFAEGVKCS